MISCIDLESEEYKDKAVVVACDTDFSKFDVGKVGFLIQNEREYLAMKAWDRSNKLINTTTFWTGPQTEQVKIVVKEIPEGRDIIGMHADTSDKNGLFRLGFVTWNENFEAQPLKIPDGFQNKFRRTAMYGYTDRVSSKVFNKDFKNLAGSKLTQWPVECDFYDMSKQELDAIHLKSVQGWSSGDDVQTI